MIRSRTRSVFTAVIVSAMLVVGLLLIPLGGRASAHEASEASDGVTAVLHSAPDDNPQAGQETSLYFTFTGSHDDFDTRYCGCKVSYMRDANRLASYSIRSLSNSATTGYAVVTFPAAGTYELSVQGYTSDELNERFQLTFPVRVAPANADRTANVLSAQSIQVIVLSTTSLILLSVVATAMIRRGGRYRHLHNSRQ